MNTLTQNTLSDTPSFLQFNQFESTGIRELTPEEIELVNGAISSLPPVPVPVPPPEPSPFPFPLPDLFPGPTGI